MEHLKSPPVPNLWSNPHEISDAETFQIPKNLLGIPLTFAENTLPQQVPVPFL